MGNQGPPLLNLRGSFSRQFFGNVMLNIVAYGLRERSNYSILAEVWWMESFVDPESDVDQRR